MAVDVSKMQRKDLLSLIDAAQKRIVQLDAGRIETARKRVDAALKAAGLTFEQVYPGTMPSKVSPAKRMTRSHHGGRLPAKYADPKNPKLQWSGHGKRPRWFVAATKAGATPESLLIRKKAK